MEQAKKLIDIAAESGADAIKFQTWIAERLFNEVRNKEIVDKLNKMALRKEWHKELFEYANKKGLIFLSTAFDEESADLLESLGVTAYKIASYELSHLPLVEHIAKKNKPVIISTGMAYEDEIRETVKCVYATGNKQIVLLYCVSQYPAKTDDVNLNSLLALKRVFGVPVGFSDHTSTIYASIAAVAMGANVIEKHFTIDKSLPGPDHSYALNPNELKQMITGIRDVEKMKRAKEVRPSEHELTERAWRRAIYAKCEIPKGTTITKDMLMVVRPSPEGSLPPKEVYNLIGKKTTSEIKKGEFITYKKVSK
ncbi:MAG: N-acetylneuraminate synthase family protein [Thermoplasmata archaeon]